VVTCYLLANVISIYADYTCYFHILRRDQANAGFRMPNWRRYYNNLANAIDVVLAHTGRETSATVSSGVGCRWRSSSATAVGGG
jgi:hypothetical protein